MLDDNLLPGTVNCTKRWHERHTDIRIAIANIFTYYLLRTSDRSGLVDYFAAIARDIPGMILSRLSDVFSDVLLTGLVPPRDQYSLMVLFHWMQASPKQYESLTWRLYIKAIDIVRRCSIYYYLSWILITR